MKVKIKNFNFPIPARVIAFFVKIALKKKKEDLGLTKKEINKLVNLARKEIVNFKRRNGSFVLFEVTEKNGETIKLTI